MNTKLKFLSAVASVGLFASAATSAFATDIVLTWPSGYGDFPDGGGEFTAVTADPTLVTPYLVNGGKATRVEGSTLGFQTFCIEFTEEFYPGAHYTYDISPYARNGGLSAGPDGTDFGGGVKIDPVSVGTAYLYSQFAKGVLSGYNYTPSSGPGSREESARSLQNLIWFLEGEKAAPLSDALTSNWLTELAQHFGALASLKQADDAVLHIHGATAASYGVAALNLGPNDQGTGYNVQDQLVYQGGGFQHLPDGGATLAMLGMGVIGLLACQRRVSKV